MKIIVTGSLGNISQPLAKTLIAQGHNVTVVSSDPKKQTTIEDLGATAAIGSLSDLKFLNNTFKGADAVYAMIPLSFTDPDPGAYMHRMAQNYAQAVRDNNIKRVVVLSGWAADLVESENVEHLFDNIDASVTFLRPGAFYTNFYQSMDLIKGKGLLGKYLTLRYNGLGALLKGKTGVLMGNYGGEDRIVFVSPKDIADAAAEELQPVPPAKELQPVSTAKELQPVSTAKELQPVSTANELQPVSTVKEIQSMPKAKKPQSTGTHKIRYVGSEEMTCNEAARIIGTAIGKPWLKWVLLSDKEMLNGLKMAKLPEKLAESLVEMQAAMHSGKTLENFHRNQPVMGKVRLPEFAKEFAQVYHNKERN